MDVKTLLISFHINEAGIPLLLVGTKRPTQWMNIINAFEGEEAEELYKRLITTKEDQLGKDETT